MESGLRGKALLGLLLAALTAWPAQAARTPGFALGLRGGAVLAHTDLTGRLGAGGGILLRRGISPRFALEVSGSYGQMVTEDSQWWNPAAPDPRAVDSYTTDMGMAELRLLLAPFAWERGGPYAFAGGGIDYYNTADQTFRRGAATGKGSTGIVPVGLGWRSRLGEAWTVELTAGYTFAFSDRIDELDEGRYLARFGTAGRQDNFAVVSLGLVHEFHRQSAPRPAARPGPAKPAAVAPAPRPAEDQDGDGLTDQQEKYEYFTNPLLADSDSDGLTDGDEVRRYRTDANRFDTDGGGIDDGQEVRRGTNPLVADDDLPRPTPARATERPAARAESVAKEPAVPAVPAVPAAKAYRFPVVYFEFGGSILSPEAKEDLRAAARALAAGPHLRLELRGHSDNAGTPQANERISALRAEAVKQFLVGQGIAASRLTTRALADRQPAATNATAEGRRANRRTELVPIH